jgi:heme A synthase
VTAKLYQPNIRPPDTAVLPEAALTLGMAVLRQLAWVGWLIVVLGLSTRIVGRRLTACLLVTAAVYLVYAFVYQTDDASVNLLPALLLITSLLAAGLSRAGAWALLAPLGLLLLNGQAVTPRPAELPRDRAVTILEKAPADAILLTPGDRGIFALWYFQHVEHLGANLAVVDQNLLAFDWYRARLVEQYPSLLALDHDNITHFRTANGQRRAVCDVPPDLAGELVCAHPDTS